MPGSEGRHHLIVRDAALDIRLDPEIKARIEKAAELSHESVDSFVVRAATAAADRILARTDDVPPTFAGHRIFG